ncbi:TetR family transcriptional regulator [Nonomuraea sp. NN258]|uniref:TetR/AcrR family transcriptional regulator C-terminal domain-containing protein n=1 Tax=Nonomuraea antri TaxID=2730852 RepID=UPI00156905C2|nr:TetR/AcrR family transcriptional regulator C-terminal domain-containing protein [Nonomuraea antri]NRQ39863.1 TetR family transcriptional regulator [Nonomuraea antri]
MDETRTPRQGLTRQTVIEAALRLLDEVGLDGLSTRRLAAELGVKSPALYWHFRDKQELLDRMAESILLAGGMGPPGEGESWQEWLTRRAHNYRAILLAHRDGARLVADSRLGPEAIRMFDRELAAMVACGFTPVLALRAITALSRYVTGFVLQEQLVLREQPERSGGGREGAREEWSAALAGLLPGGESAPLAVAVRDGGDLLGEQTFGYGVTALIDGTATALRAAAE